MKDKYKKGGQYNFEYFLILEEYSEFKHYKADKLSLPFR